MPNPVRRLSVPPLASLEGQGRGSVGGGGPPGGVSHTLPPASSSVYRPHPMPSYAPTSIKGAALEEVTLALIAKGAVELAPLPSPGFYSRLFVVWKTSGSWRPVIDLSLLNHFVDVSHFRMETIQPFLLSVRQGDWMASIDLREAYLQVPVHPESRLFLRFVAHGRTYQFKALCFGLSMALQVFTQVMAPVSAILHSLGIRMRRYLDDWLVQASSREALLRDLGVVLSLCRELGIVIKQEKSNFSPSQMVQYLGVVIDARTFMASQSPDRDSRLRLTSGEFLCSATPPASLWQSLLGMLSSLSHLVPGGRLRMRSLQICLHRSWDQLDPSAPVPWSPDCLRDLRWWIRGDHLSHGVSLHQVSDASDVGWGAHLGDRVVFSLWDQSEALFLVNAREFLEVRHGLLHLQFFLSGTTVAMFCDNVTAVAYLRKEGGHLVSCSQHHCAGDPLLGGISSDLTGSAVYSGDSQCSRGHSLPSSPAPQLRVVSQHGRISIFDSSVAGDDRPICHL